MYADVTTLTTTAPKAWPSSPATSLSPLPSPPFASPLVPRQPSQSSPIPLLLLYRAGLRNHSTVLDLDWIPILVMPPSLDIFGFIGTDGTPVERTTVGSAFFQIRFIPSPMRALARRASERVFSLNGVAIISLFIQQEGSRCSRQKCSKDSHWVLMYALFFYKSPSYVQRL